MTAVAPGGFAIPEPGDLIKQHLALSSGGSTGLPEDGGSVHGSSAASAHGGSSVGGGGGGCPLDVPQAAPSSRTAGPASVRPRARAVSVGGGAAAPVSESTFFCGKCQWNQPMSVLRIRSGAKICEMDVRAYGGLQARWNANRQLRSWWKDLPNDKKVEWYRNRQQSETGKKRTADELMHGDFSKDAAFEDKAELDELIPWRIYRRRAMQDGDSEPQAAVDFVNIIKNNQVNCLFHRGEWHVPEYQGVQRKAGRRSEHGSQDQRGYRVQSSAELANLSAASGQAVERQLQSLQAASQQGSRALRSDTPAIMAGQAQQPAMAPAADIVLAGIVQEALWVNSSMRFGGL